MVAVNLSSAARTGLSTLRNIADQMATTQNRLVTGKAVNSPIDDVSKFFTAASMDARAATIDTLMDNINTAQSSLKAASEGIKGIQGLLKEARSLTSQALTTSDTTVRSTLATQFNTLRTEIGRIAKDAGVNGTNLLDGDNLNLALNEDGTSKTTITGTAITDLGVAAAAGNWATDANIKAAFDALVAAGDTLETNAKSFGSSQAILNTRKEFNSSLSNILKSGSSELTAADMDAEAANLMALQTRQQMASTALSIMQSTETTALRLLR